MMSPIEVHVDSGGASGWEILSTLGILAAVVVALFGPSFRDWLRRPKIRLVDDPIAMLDTAALAADKAWERHHKGPLAVGIKNGGQTQANDVQLFVTVALVQGRGSFVNYADQEPWPFRHREGGSWQEQHSVSIPSGLTRKVTLFEFQPSTCSLASFGKDARQPLETGPYYVALDVVGSNFKVTRFYGGLGVDGEVAVWLLALHESDYDPDVLNWDATNRVADLKPLNLPPDLTNG